MQKKDDDNPRGYTLKSIVILSQLPLISFFYRILDILDILHTHIRVGCLKSQLQVFANLK